MHDLDFYYSYCIKLQQIYQARAEADVTALEARVVRILKQIGQDSPSIAMSTIKLFCKNDRNLRVRILILRLCYMV
jgi:amyloid beta precursor protein binding protein 1